MTRIVENRMGVLVSTEAAAASSGFGDAGRIPELDAAGLLDPSFFPGSGLTVSWGDIIGTLTDQVDLVAALAAKLDDSQASAYGLTVIAAANAAALKTLLALVKADVGLGNVDNTSDATKNSAAAILTNKDLTSATNLFPILNQNTTGSAATLTTGRNFSLNGGGITSATVSFNGSGAVVLVPVLGAITPTSIVSAGNVTGLNLSGTNTGDQTTIAGITGTKAQFNTACTDGNFLYVGDITQYTDEMAQDAVGAMVDGTLVYVDATPLLTRAAISGDITVAQGSNVAAITAGVIVNSDINAAAAIAFSKMVALTASRALVSDGSGIVSTIGTTAAELLYVNGVTSAIQTQIDGKQPLDGDLTSWAAITRAAGFDTFATTPTSANFAALLTNETGTGSVVFSDAPTFTGIVNVAALTASGIITAGTASAVVSGSDGFKQAAYSANARNPIWRFGNADAYGMSYFQGSAGLGGLDVIGVHFGTATAAGSTLQILQGTGINVQSNVYASGNIEAGSYFKSHAYTVATLPAAATAGAGARSYVTDALAPTFLTAVVGGGAIATPVFSDGASWKAG